MFRPPASVTGGRQEQPSLDLPQLAAKAPLPTLHPSSHSHPTPHSNGEGFSCLISGFLNMLGQGTLPGKNVDWAVPELGLSGLGYLGGKWQYGYCLTARACPNFTSGQSLCLKRYGYWYYF